MRGRGRWRASRGARAARRAQTRSGTPPARPPTPGARCGRARAGRRRRAGGRSSALRREGGGRGWRSPRARRSAPPLAPPPAPQVLVLARLQRAQVGGGGFRQGDDGKEGGEGDVVGEVGAARGGKEGVERSLRTARAPPRTRRLPRPHRTIADHGTSPAEPLLRAEYGGGAAPRSSALDPRRARPPRISSMGRGRCEGGSAIAGGGEE